MAGIYKHSNFISDHFGHGGNKRSAQISQLLINANIKYTDADFSPFLPSKSLYSFIKGINYSKRFTTGFKNKYAIGKYLNQFEGFVMKNRPSFFIWESTFEHYLLLAQILHKYDIPFVAIPHNIESLVKGSRSVFSNQLSPYWFLEEIEYLKYCNQVFTISEEEQWLLSIYDVKTSYLPYYPTEQLKEHLLSIRSKKQDHKKNPTSQLQILLLGTFYNRPTYNGYLKIIEQIKGNTQIKIHIAGYGSEQLKNIYSQDNIMIWGSISNEELTRLIVTCDYAVIHQEPSSGALTRIPEFLIAGLPVFVNIHAARSCFSFDGVTVYNTYDELMDLIHSNLKQMPSVLERPAEEKYFIDYIKGITLNKI